MFWSLFNDAKIIKYGVNHKYLCIFAQNLKDNVSLATAQHFDAAIALSQRWNLSQCIGYGSCLLQYSSSHSGTHGVALHVSLRQLTFYYHLLQQLGSVRQQFPRLILCFKIFTEFR